VKWAAALALGLFGALVYAADRGALPEALYQIYSIPGGDKLGHFVIVAVLAYALNRAFSGRMVRLNENNFLLGSVLVALIVTLEETSQLFFPARTFSLLDLGSDFLGLWLVSWLILRERRIVS